MRRSSEEFKSEIFRREKAYKALQKRRVKRLAQGTMCLALILAGGLLARPYFTPAMETAADNAVMEDCIVDPPQYSLAGGVAADAEPMDICPAVMIDGILYYDTRCVSEETVRCGVMDGIIEKSTDGSIPVEDDQSNFGTGYGYQYGSEEGTIEILINEKWCIFAAHK